MHVIGCDVGSQSLKAVLIDDRGATVAEAGEPYAVHYPRPGWAEQDPRIWREALAHVIPSLLARAGVDRRSVGALGIAAQVDGLVAVDAQLQPVGPAIIWLDRRATDQAERLRERLDAAVVLETTGSNLDASHVGPKIMWLRDEHPELVTRTARYLLPGSYLLAALTGECAIDGANASSTLLYDVRRRAWAPELLDAAGIDDRLLARIAPAHEIVSTLTPRAAEEVGLTTACRVVVGTGDEHGASLGAGAIREDVICDITGTAEPVAVGTQRFVLDPTGLVETHAHADDRAWLVENPGFVSGASVRWLLDVLRDDEGSLNEARAVPPGADGLTFLPTMSGATTPVWNDHARGVYAGLGLNHGRAHLARALLEGCSFALRDLVDRFATLGLGQGEIRVVGGGARSDLWLQMKADVTGRTVRTVVAREATAVGAGMLAAVGCGLFAGIDEAVEAMTVVAPRAYDPDSDVREAYEDAYQRYRAVFAAMLPLFDGAPAR